MSERVPEGWLQYKVEQIGPFFNGLTGKTSSDFGKGEPFLNYMQIFKQQLSYNSGAGFVEILEGEKQNTVQYGDILFTTSSETPAEIGMTAVFLETKWSPYLNSFCFGLRPHKNFPLVPEFANQFFRGDTFREDIRPLAQGSTRYNLSKENLKQLSITIPPLPEQKRIASILTSVDEVIEKTQSLIDKLQDLKTGTMNELLTKGIGHTEFKDSELGRIPSSWEVKNLPDCLERIVDCEHRTAPEVESSTFYVVSTNAVKAGELLEPQLYKTSEEAYQTWTARETPVSGDVLFTREAPAGESCCVPEHKKVCLGQRMVLLRPTSSILSSGFLNFFINSDVGKCSIYRLSLGTTVSRINIEDIKKLKIALPSTTEQNSICEIVCSIEVKIQKLVKTRISCQNLKKSLMQDLLTGKVRVTVN